MKFKGTVHADADSVFRENLVSVAPEEDDEDEYNEDEEEEGEQEGEGWRWGDASDEGVVTEKDKTEEQKRSESQLLVSSI